MRRPAEFKRAYAAGKRLGNEFFTVNAQANGLGCARLGHVDRRTNPAPRGRP